MAAEVEDAEAATHGNEAASYQVVETYEFPGFKIVQFDLAVLSHYSYMLISDGECLVIDPGRDIFAYVAMAEKEGVKITGVWLTHSHADFVAGHVEFAEQLGSHQIRPSRRNGRRGPICFMSARPTPRWSPRIQTALHC